MIIIKRNAGAVLFSLVLASMATANAQTAPKCADNTKDCVTSEQQIAKTGNNEEKTLDAAVKLTTSITAVNNAGFAAKPVKADPLYPTKPPSDAENTSLAQAKEEAQAQAAQDPEALRKAAQNPIASLISVPFQNNTNFAVGPNNDRVQNVLVIQPVIPVAITPSVNMIMRLITPIVYQPNTAPPTPATPSGAFGLGDFNPSFFFSPSKASKFIWGVGPTFIFPTASSSTLGQGKMQIGPTFVWLVQPGKWTVGTLFNNTWSVAGKSSRPSTNQGIFQYFINYNLKKGYYLTWQPTITFNWKATGADRWLVPFGGGVGRIMKVGPQPMNISIQAFANPIRQPNTSPFTLRFSVALLYPKK